MLEKYTGASVDVVIPDNVVVIGDYSFKNTMIASIKIPDSVNKIGNGAFMDCKVLREVKIPGSVKEIEYSAFSSCVSLKRVYLSDGIQKIGEKAFCSCKALEAINMPKSLTDIGRDAFADCSSIKEFGILDSSVSTIREGVLSALGSNVTSITLPKCVKTIERGAFTNTNISEITILSDIIYLHYGGLSNESIRKISFQENTEIHYITTEFDSRDHAYEKEEPYYKQLGGAVHPNTEEIYVGKTRICVQAIRQNRKLLPFTPFSVSLGRSWQQKDRCYFCGSSDIKTIGVFNKQKICNKCNSLVDKDKNWSDVVCRILRIER